MRPAAVSHPHPTLHMPAKFLTAQWRKLIMAQYAVPPATLTPHLPPGVQLDLFEGQCFVSLVGFLFDRVRLKGFPIPFHTRFEEINLRFYVRRPQPDGTIRRGVVFIREFVPRAAITLIANSFYEEPYATLPTRHSFVHRADSQYIEYGWKHGRDWNFMGVDASLQSQPILEHTLEDFITEHYWGFTKRTQGSTSQYQVEHPRWQTYPILTHEIRTGFAALYGPAFALLNTQPPHSILLAEGSPIAVYSGTRLPPS